MKTYKGSKTKKKKILVPMKTSGRKVGIITRYNKPKLIMKTARRKKKTIVVGIFCFAGGL